MKFVLSLLILTAAGAAYLGGKRLSAPSATANLAPVTQTQSSGEVTVTATYQAGQVKLVLDTHSVDLSGFDFKTQVDPRPDTVEVLVDSAHHRQVNLQYTRLGLPFALTLFDLAQVPQRQLVFESPPPLR